MEALNARLRPEPIAVLACERSPTTGTRGSRASAGDTSTASATAVRR
jgi:hypothetical protein